MMRVISITSPIAATGRTTTAINLASSFAAYERKTLLIDCDPRNDCIRGTFVQPPHFNFGLDNVLKDEACLKDAILKTPLTCLKFIPAGKDLADTRHTIGMNFKRPAGLFEKLQSVSNDFEFVVIDTPSGPGPFSKFAAAASDQLLIPLRAELLESKERDNLIGRLEEFFHDLKDSENDTCNRIVRKDIVLTKCDDRHPVTSSAMDAFQNLILFPTIPYDKRLHEARLFGKPVVLFDIMSPGAAVYLSLAKELIRGAESDALLMEAAKEPAVKLTDIQIVRKSEKQLIETLIAHMDLAALKSAVQKKFNLNVCPELKFETGDLVIYDDEIAYKINFNGRFSVVLNRKGDQLALLAQPERLENIPETGMAAKHESGAETETDKRRLREKAARMAAELADMISEINH